MKISGNISSDKTTARKLLKVRVLCDANMHEMAPQCFFIGSRKVEVIDVVDRWLETDHGYFKVHADDGTYILKNDALAGDWELTLYDSGTQLVNPTAVTATKAYI